MTSCTMSLTTSTSPASSTRDTRNEGQSSTGGNARRYVGYCIDDLDIEAAIRRIRDERETVFAEIRSVEAVSGRELKHARRFLEDFFDDAEDIERLSARFEKSCQG